LKFFFQAFAVLALLPFITSLPDHGGHFVHHAPVHHAPAYGHPAPHYGGYGYEEPKHNCSVLDVTQVAEECTPVILTACAAASLPIKIIKDAPFTYTVVRTVCTLGTETVNQEVCNTEYSDYEEETTGKTVEISFEKVEKVQMVTVCQPIPTYPAYPAPAPYGGYGGHPHFGKRSADGPVAHGHGHGYGYGKHCKEVAQTTTYSVPKATVVEPPVTVLYPKPSFPCVDKPFELPTVQCADIEEEKTIMVPQVEDSEAFIEKCVSTLGAPDCKGVELTLPKQVCKELNFGHTADVAEYAKPEPAYAPAPAPAYAPAPHA